MLVEKGNVRPVWHNVVWSERGLQGQIMYGFVSYFKSHEKSLDLIFKNITD